MHRYLLALALICLTPTADAGQRLVGPGDDWSGFDATSVTAGDEIILMPGQHRPGLLRGLKGTPGPMNLTGLDRGRQVHRDVLFEIDRAIALRGSMFPQDRSLPRALRGIRVGRKAAGLYFLHCFLYPAHDREHSCRAPSGREPSPSTW